MVVAYCQTLFYEDIGCSGTRYKQCTVQLHFFALKMILFCFPSTFDCRAVGILPFAGCFFVEVG